MKRRKQFLALSLVAAMVLGGVFNPGTFSSVQAEEAQTEQPSVSGGDASVSGGDAMIPGTDSGTTAETKTVTGSVDLSSGLLAGATYGDENAVKISVLENMTAKSASVSTSIDNLKGDAVPDDFVINYSVAGSSNPDQKNGNIPTTGAVVKLEVVQDCKVTFVVKGGNKAFYCVQDVGETAGVDAAGVVSETAALDSTHVYSVQCELKAGNTYYAYASGSKATYYGILYSYEEVVEVKTETVTEKVDLSGGLLAGTMYGDENAVKISVLENMTAKSASVSTSIDNLKGDAVPDDFVINYSVAGSSNPDQKNGNIPTTGAVVKLEVVQDCKVTFVVKGGNKAFYCVQDVGETAGVDAAGVVSETAALDSTHVYSVQCELKAGNTYYAYASGSKATYYGILYTYEKVVEDEPELPDIELIDGIIAFPGAEGGGQYATGGRGGDVYVVTNLNDSGEGSLRYGIETAPAAGRIIVFDVGGTINLESTLTFKNKANITIAGQTAPGDGITIAGYDTNISDSENIVIRFVRFRVGTENLLNGGDSMDALWGRDNDTFIIDHCTFSWNTDETLSTYRGKNGTVQWCIISESLTVSGHSKGRHGYGGIWGGDNTVFQYNLLTNHTSRNPRIGGGSMTDPTVTLSYGTLQLSNNVLYNHGYFPCYGGGFAYTNYINNYVKPGIGTRESLADTLIHVGENNKDGGFYVAGNILEGNDAITNNNALGIKEDTPGYISSTAYTPSEENPTAFNVSLVSAADCYDLVLANAGATYPYRDAVDARVVAQVKTNTGFYINTPDEVGGYPARTVTAAEIGRIDSDGDGIPDEWETAHGLNPNDSLDSRNIASDDAGDPNYGYAWIEVYFNELVEEVVALNYAAPNPDVTIDLENNTLVNEGTDITVTAAATANNGGSIAKVEFYNGSTLVYTDDSAPYSYTYSGLTDGTYNISVRAYDNEGNAIQSNTSKLHVNSTAGTGNWTSVDVGQPGVKGTASLTDGVLTVKGAGKLGKSEGSVSGSDLNNAATDDFQFVYQELTGDVELVAKLDSFTAVDNHTFNGLMFRESLDEDAATVAVGLTMTKIYDGDNTTWAAFLVNRAAKGGAISDISESIDSESGAAQAGISIVHGLNFKTGNTFNGTWLKLTRIGDEFTASVSEDGLVWQTIGTVTVELPETAYVGFAVEAGKAANELENYSTAKFSDITINNALGTITYELEDVDYSGADHFALGDDFSVILSSVRGYLLPETVEVIIDGRIVDAAYDSETGIISLENVQGDVVIKAQGVKRVVVPVDFEEVDDNDLLTVEEKDGKLILTQTATAGSVAKGVATPAENESFILFPAVDQFHEFTLKLKVTSLLPIGGNDNTGVFVGVFADETPAFNTLGFRPIALNAASGADESVSAFWMKGETKVGNGSPKQPMRLNEEYTISFSDDGKNQYLVEWWDADGTYNTKTFKANEGYIQKGDVVRYGIGLIGATVEITEMKLVDHEDNVIYYQDSADYSAVTAAIEKASQLAADDYENFDAVLEAWDAVVYGLPSAEQAKVDAMAQAIETALNNLVKKAVKTETTRSILVDAQLETVMAAKGWNTIDAVTEYMKSVVLTGKFADADSVVVDVSVYVLNSEGKWVKATAETFPEEGVDVILPYPEGTGKTGYSFSVGHLITIGQKAGEIEDIKVLSLEEEGLKVHLNSASPFLIAYSKASSEPEEPGNTEDPGDTDKPGNTEEPGNTENPGDTDKPAAPAPQPSNPSNTASDSSETVQTGTNVSTQAAKTGDNMNVGVIISSIVLLAAIAGAGVLIYLRKRRTEGSDN